ncbi:hypothetical protein ACFOLF_32595 [Paenibacillus sepulcri]|uniref:Uncharacterized protein n=1 Tax=Paenibacillus sepulcri TaxID=359917 RepID=A0ABS7C5I3_9BACL|nr:hypothetical protein [Paenibacillus sepulcri]
MNEACDRSLPSGRRLFIELAAFIIVERGQLAALCQLGWSTLAIGQRLGVIMGHCP